MKKRLMAILICVLLLVTIIPGVASAKGNDTALYTDSQFKTLERMVAQANRQISHAVKVAQNTPYDDVAWLLSYVDGVVANVMAYANSIGASVVCEYTEYYVDGQYVLIDPLRVIPL